MHSTTIDLMREQVRIIYRAATGTDLNEDADSDADDRTSTLLTADVERSFAELDALARRNPAIGERVPPFSFTPLVDIIDTGRDLIVEFAALGVESSDVEIEATADELTISGVRRGEPLSHDRVYLHAEIPRGPFHRTIRLPCAIESHEAIDARRGVLVLRLRKSRSIAQPKTAAGNGAGDHNIDE